MTTQDATYFILNKVRTIYPEGEASQITDWVMENLTGSKKAERMVYKNTAITNTEELLLQQITERLMHHEPVQYVLNEAWFCGLKFYVDKNVLIPRPDTEELVEWMIGTAGNREAGGGRQDTRVGSSGQNITILDIGTGSGCIAVSVKRKLNNAEVWSCDISEEALLVAKKNAETLGIGVNFLLLDFLNKEKRNSLPSFDIIISNPPYVPLKDKSQMHPNVLNYEPHTALFVPDEDALIFYEAIADFGKEHLKLDGIIYAETHEDLSDAVSQLFKTYGYLVEGKKDMQGKERMIKAGFRLATND